MISNLRLKQIMAGVADERSRFNQAIAAGKIVTIKTAFGPYTVTAVNGEHWYSTTAGRSFCGCNDAQWADMLKQAGVERAPIFNK